MPWQVADAKSFTKKATTPKSKRAFAHAANSVLASTNDNQAPKSLLFAEKPKEYKTIGLSWSNKQLKQAVKPDLKDTFK